MPGLDAGITFIPGLPWESLSHRQVLAALAIQGWVPCGVGDWAVALRSPEGTLVARVCPFDPAYAAFVDLCRECAGNRWLPWIELAADLEGGGSVVFLEYVAPVDHPVVKQFAEQWLARGDDAEFQEVCRAAQMIDAQYRESTPWWGGYDLNDAHICRAAGRLVLLDLFCMAGADLYKAILEDVAEVHRRIPRERMRYALDIPYIARENSTAEILALKEAWTHGSPLSGKPIQLLSFDLTSHISIVRTNAADRRGCPGKCHSPAVESNSDPRDMRVEARRAVSSSD